MGAPGISHAERLFSGVATVLVPQNIQHAALCDAWENIGCGLSASVAEEEISKCIHILLRNKFELAQSISVRGQSILDGKGAERLLNFIFTNITPE